jgi:hypothetical protein
VINPESPDGFLLKVSGAVTLGAPPSPPAASLDNSQISFWLDERGNQPKISVKYSDGTLKTAAIPLT